jgi:hypothetical protein
LNSISVLSNPGSPPVAAEREPCRRFSIQYDHWDGVVERRDCRADAGIGKHFGLIKDSEGAVIANGGLVQQMRVKDVALREGEIPVVVCERHRKAGSPAGQREVGIRVGEEKPRHELAF